MLRSLDGRPEQEEVVACLVCRQQERVVVAADSALVRCSDCGLMYISPRPTRQAIAAFYARQDHYEPWDETGEERRKMWQRRLARVMRHVERGRVFDVGAGLGGFLARAKEHGFEVDGNELSTFGARYAKQTFGVGLRVGDLLELDLEDGSYDAVTIWHVLEHLPDTGATLEQVYRLLKPGGYLFVGVPNTPLRMLRLKSVAKRLLNRLAGRSYIITRYNIPPLRLVDPEEEIHLVHFTTASLREAIRRAGLKPVLASVDDFRPLSAPGPRLLFHFYRLAVGRILPNFTPTIYLVARRPME